MHEWLRDLRFGVRMLAKGRGISVIVVVTLALAIGVTSTIVSLIGAVLLRPFPGVNDPGGVVWFFERQGDEKQSPLENLLEVVPPPNYYKWKAETTQFDDMGAIMPSRPIIEGAGEPVRTKGFAATPNYFRLMGTKMSFGREFSADEDTPGHDAVAILGTLLPSVVSAPRQRRWAKPSPPMGARARWSAFFRQASVSPV